MLNFNKKYKQGNKAFLWNFDISFDVGSCLSSVRSIAMWALRLWKVYIWNELFPIWCQSRDEDLVLKIRHWFTNCKWILIKSRFISANPTTVFFCTLFYCLHCFPFLISAVWWTQIYVSYKQVRLWAQQIRTTR